MQQRACRLAIVSALLVAVQAWIVPTLPHDAATSAAGQCCLQDEWEGMLYVDSGHVFYDANTFMAYFNGTMHVAYSMHEQKFFYEMHALEMTPLFPHPEKGHMIILRDYKMGVSYSVSDGDCYKEDIPKMMTKQCIPADATLLSRGVFTDNSRMTETYQFTIDYQQRPLQITATVLATNMTGDAQASCEPIYGTYYTGISGAGEGDIYTFNIMDRGPITSKHVFDVPAACKHLL